MFTRVMRGLLAVLLLTVGNGRPGRAQDFSSLDRDRGIMMLRGVRRYLRDFYYDTTYHGIDLDARVRAAEEQIRVAQSNTEVFTIIAKVTLELNDSHTLFVPPQRTARVEYDWETLAVGDTVFITEVTPGSDAAAQGLAPGDRVLAVNGFPLTREALWQVEYYYDLVSPRTQLELAVERPDGTSATLTVHARVIPEPRFQDLTTEGYGALIRDWENRYRELRDSDWALGEDVLICRMASFVQDERAIDHMIDRARRFRGLVIDLRGNRGGLRTNVERLLARLFDRRVLLGVEHRRRKTDSLWVKPRGEAYSGPLVVLVDSRSASAAELLSRVAQLEHRGTVIGDRSAGAVMGSYHFGEIAGGVRSVLYGIAVTAMEMRMSDGVSLEHVGVQPDEMVLPSARDLAARRDPALARAVTLAGSTLTPEAAGALFPRR